MSSLLRQLKNLKHDARVGARSAEVHADSKARLLAAIAPEAMVEKRSLVPAPYYRFAFGSFISKPLAAGVASILVFAGGWMTTVSAAENSLPGDVLYSVKLINEQAQLRLASLDRRAVLHTEFAGKRLKEAVRLQEGEAIPERAAFVQRAMDDYERNVALAGDDLRQLQQEEPSEVTVVTASDVQQKLSALDAVIDATVTASPTAESSSAAEVARDVSRTGQQLAVDVVVEEHEEQADGQSQQQILEMFRRTLGAIETRKAFDEHRVAQIESVMVEQNVVLIAANIALPSDDDLRALRYGVLSVEDTIPQAMNSVANGGYREAFRILDEIDDRLLAVEGQLADIEIAISNVLMQAAVVEQPTETPAESAPTDTSGSVTNQ